MSEKADRRRRANERQRALMRTLRLERYRLKDLDSEERRTAETLMRSGHVVEQQDGRLVPAEGGRP